LAFHSGREADHSPPCSTEVKEWVYLHSPIRLHGVVLRGSTGATLLTLPDVHLLCTTSYTMNEDVWEIGGIAPRILNLGTRRKVVSLTSRPLYPRGKTAR
jgi:hypothetical protein